MRALRETSVGNEESRAKMKRTIVAGVVAHADWEGESDDGHEGCGGGAARGGSDVVGGGKNVEVGGVVREGMPLAVVDEELSKSRLRSC